MNCPKCGAPNPDDSVFCSLCHEGFKPKAAAPRRSTRININEASASFEGWGFAGPFVATENGIYLFAKRCENPHEKKGGLATKIGGEVGGLGGAIIGAIIDSQLDSDNSPMRPDKLDFQPTRNIIEQCQESLGEAPDIPSCKDYFCVRKGEIKKMSYDFLSNLAVKTAFSEITYSGIEPVERCSVFFKKNGYPLED